MTSNTLHHCLYIEGISPIFCHQFQTNNITDDILQIFNSLPTTDWGVNKVTINEPKYQKSKLLYIIKIKLQSKYDAKYYILYDPQSNEDTKWLIQFSTRSLKFKENVDAMIEYIKTPNMENFKKEISNSFNEFFNATQELIPISKEYNKFIEEYKQILKN